MKLYKILFQTGVSRPAHTKDLLR